MRWEEVGDHPGHEFGAAGSNRKYTGSHHEGAFSVRQPVVVTATGCRLLLSSGGEGAIREWQAAAPGSRQSRFMIPTKRKLKGSGMMDMKHAEASHTQIL